MSQKAPTQQQQMHLLAELGKGLAERMGSMESALAALGVSSQKGVTPADVFKLHGSAGDGRQKSSTRLHKGIGWGEYLKDLYHACTSPASDWAQKMMEKHGAQLVSKTALAEGTGTTGGYTVPQQFANQLLALSIEESIIRQLCTTIPMTGRSLLVPTLDQTGTPPTDGTAFVGGISLAWTEEAATPGETEPTFAQIELVAHELTAYSELSNTLLADSAVALDALLTGLITRAFAWAFDYYILRGSGAGKPLGVINAPCTIAVARGTNTTFKLADAANMLGRLVASSMKTACWAMSQTMIPQLVQLADAGNNVVFIPNFGGAAPGMGGAAMPLPMSLFGLPIFFTEKLPALGTKGDVLLADFSHYILGDRMELQLEASPHYKFKNNQMAWRAVARWDGQPWLKNKVTLADGTTTVSPFVCLDVAA